MRRHFNSFITSEWSVNLTRGMRVIIIKVQICFSLIQELLKSFRTPLKCFFGRRSDQAVYKNNLKTSKNSVQGICNTLIQNKNATMLTHSNEREQGIRIYEKLRQGPFRLISFTRSTMGGEVCKKNN